VGRKLNQCECCCWTKSLYEYSATFTPAATDDRFDVDANYVSLRRPLRGQGADIYYVTPPSGFESESVARVRLFDNPAIEAKLTAKLVPRNMPAEWFPLMLRNYNAAATYSFPSALSVGGISWAGSSAYYALDINEAPSPGALIEVASFGQPQHFNVYGVTNLAQPAAAPYSAIPGTPLQDLAAPARDGLGDIVLFCAYQRIRTRYSSNTIDGGWITSATPNNWPNGNATRPMVTSGFDSSFFMEFGSASRWVILNTNDSPRLGSSVAASSIQVQGVPADSIQPGRRSLAVLTLEVASFLGAAYPGDVRETGFFTAFVPRPEWPFNAVPTPRSKHTGAFAIVNPEIAVASGTSAAALPFYTNVGISHFRGNECVAYRNGTEILRATRPTATQSAAVGADEGSYLLVSELTGASENPAVPAWYMAGENPHKEFVACVVDKTPPVVAFEAVSDFYAFTINQNWLLPTTLLATEPVQPAGGGMADLDAQGVLVAGFPTSSRGSLISGGTYRILPPFHESAGGSLALQGLRDLAGNAPSAVMEHNLTVHPYPTPWILTGSRPTLQRFDRRTRLQTERVSTVRLSFDRKIDPAGVSISQVTLKKNNEVVSGCSLAPSGDGTQEWIISVPADIQTPRSFFLLEYNPAGNVYSNDIVTARYDSRNSFPRVGAYKTKYVHKDSDGVDQWFSWNGTTYRSIGANDFPLLPPSFGGNYRPEASLIVARTSWLMADTNARPRLIDCTRGYSSALGRVASIGFQSQIDTTKTTSEAESNEPPMPAVNSNGFGLGDIQQRVNEVRIRQRQNRRRGFLPSVPPPTAPRASHSYWGLGYTIDPCPPAKVHECAAPTEHQRHSSIMISNDEIQTLKVALELRDSSGNLVTDFDSRRPAIYADADVIAEPYSTIVGKMVAPHIMAIEGHEYTFGTSLQGRALSQNVWGCKEGAGSGAYQSLEWATKSPVRCTQNGLDYYIVTMTENFGTTPIPAESFKKFRKVRATFERSAMQAMVTADRHAWVYPQLQTATLVNLGLFLSFRMAVKRTTYYTEYEIQGSPLGYIGSSGSVCPSSLVQQGGPFVANATRAVFAASQAQEVAAHQTECRFFDYVNGKVWLSKQEETALGQGSTVWKELFVEPGSPNIWTVKIRKG
jgi:hypothetical protein